MTHSKDRILAKYPVYSLTKTVSPHSVNVIIRCCSTPRLFDIFVSALKVLRSMIDKRENTTGAFACSAFGFYATCIQTCRRKTVISEINKWLTIVKLFLVQLRTSLRHIVFSESANQKFRNLIVRKNCCHGKMVFLSNIYGSNPRRHFTRIFPTH